MSAAFGAGGGLQPVDLLEDVRRQPADLVKFFHDDPIPTQCADRSGSSASALYTHSQRRSIGPHLRLDPAQHLFLALAGITAHLLCILDHPGAPRRTALLVHPLPGRLQMKGALPPFGLGQLCPRRGGTDIQIGIAAPGWSAGGKIGGGFFSRVGDGRSFGGHGRIDGRRPGCGGRQGVFDLHRGTSRGKPKDWHDHEQCNSLEAAGGSWHAVVPIGRLVLALGWTAMKLP